MVYLKLFLLVLFAALSILIGPILTIWALNTLFPVLAIPTTIETWAAAGIVGIVLSGGLFSSSK